MSKSARRAKTNKRAASKPQPRRTGLCWPDVLTKFADWLIQSDWAADSFTAYSAAIAVDQSARERNIPIRGPELPMELFEVEDYTTFFLEHCGHTPWTHDDIVAALGLFAMFVVAERISTKHIDVVSEVADAHAPLGPLRFPSPPRLTTALGPIALTSHLQRVALHCEDNGSVPVACFVHPERSSEVREKLGLVSVDDMADAGDALSLIRYRIVLAAAVGADILSGTGHELVPGREFDSWLGTPGQHLLHRSLVAAFAACFDPIFETDDMSAKLELVSAAATLRVVLLRSMVDDPTRDGDVMSTGTGTDSKRVSMWMTVRLADMISLGLIVAVNGKFCVPDTHMAALLEALDLDRAQRTRVAA